MDTTTRLLRLTLETLAAEQGVPITGGALLDKFKTNYPDIIPPTEKDLNEMGRAQYIDFKGDNPILMNISVQGKQKLAAINADLNPMILADFWQDDNGVNLHDLTLRLNALRILRVLLKGPLDENALHAKLWRDDTGIPANEAEFAVALNQVVMPGNIIIVQGKIQITETPSELALKPGKQFYTEVGGAVTIAELANALKFAQQLGGKFKINAAVRPFAPKVIDQDFIDSLPTGPGTTTTIEDLIREIDERTKRPGKR